MARSGRPHRWLSSVSVGRGDVSHFGDHFYEPLDVLVQGIEYLEAEVGCHKNELLDLGVVCLYAIQGDGEAVGSHQP